MSARRGAKLLALGRGLLGLAVLAAPERVTGRWLGPEDAARPVVAYLSRSLGARDLALALATLQTLDDPVLGPRVQLACALVDCTDAAATVIEREALPAAGAYGTMLVAGGAALAGFYFSHRLAHA